MKKRKIMSLAAMAAGVMIIAGGCAGSANEATVSSSISKVDSDSSFSDVEDRKSSDFKNASDEEVLKEAAKSELWHRYYKTENSESLDGHIIEYHSCGWDRGIIITDDLKAFSKTGKDEIKLICTLDDNYDHSFPIMTDDVNVECGVVICSKDGSYTAVYSEKSFDGEDSAVSKVNFNVKDPITAVHGVHDSSQLFPALNVLTLENGALCETTFDVDGNIMSEKKPVTIGAQDGSTIPNENIKSAELCNDNILITNKKNNAFQTTVGVYGNLFLILNKDFGMIEKADRLLVTDRRYISAYTKKDEKSNIYRKNLSVLDKEHKEQAIPMPEGYDTEKISALYYGTSSNFVLETDDKSVWKYSGTTNDNREWVKLEAVSELNSRGGLITIYPDGFVLGSDKCLYELR